MSNQLYRKRKNGTDGKLSLPPQKPMSEGRQKRQKALKAAYGDLYAEVSRLLREADPINLIQIGAPDDEYDLEVSTILPRLREAHSAVDVQRIIHEEFVHWFNVSGVAGPEESYADVAERIWAVWCNFVTHRT